MNKPTIHVNREANLGALHEAFRFQVEAVEAIKDLEYAAVFHEQGLGKTKIAIDTLLHWLTTQTVDSVIVVTKRGLVPNWAREFKSHTHIKPRVLSQDRHANFIALNSPVRVYLTHYEVLNSENERLRLFQKTRKVGIIFDESQKIKNPDAIVTQSAISLSEGFVRRLILTGTPIANRPFDLWSQIYFLDLGKSLGTDFKLFKSDLDLDASLATDDKKRIDFESQLSELFQKISSFSVRETKASGAISLPSKEIQTIRCEWENKQYEMYQSIKNEMKAIVVKNGVPTEDNADALLKRLLRLVQIASNPKVIDESYHCMPGKMEALLDIIEPIINHGEKAIIWTSFTKNADWLAKELQQFGCVKVHGKMPQSNRTHSIDQFLDNAKKRILIATPGAAKEGFTLTVSNHVIFYDRGFSLDDYLQAQDRIHRISQKKVCYVYNLLMKDSIDEWVDVLLKAKHLAAQLGQGDISIEEYRLYAKYEFSYVLSEILGINE